MICILILSFHLWRDVGLVCIVVVLYTYIGDHSSSDSAASFFCRASCLVRRMKLG